MLTVLRILSPFVQPISRTIVRERRVRMASSSTSSSSSSSSNGSEQAPKRARADVVQEKPQRLFHIVFSTPHDSGMKSPEEFTKEEFGNLLLSTAETVFKEGNKALKVSVFAEKHKNGKLHYHCPFLADKPFRSAVLRRTLADQKCYTYFETSHSFYWTAFVYCAVPTPEKPSIDSNPWLSPGHPCVLDCLADVPRGAARILKERVRTWLGTQNVAMGATKSRCMDSVEFSAWVTTHQLHTKVEVLAALSKQLPETEAAAQYCYKHFLKLDQIVAFAWEVKAAPSVEAEMNKSAWDMVLDAASRDCTCAGKWASLAQETMLLQSKDFPAHVSASEVPTPDKVRAAHQIALRQGAGKYRNVFHYGPRNAGKSFMLAPLQEIFGERWCFVRPAGTSNFPLQALIGKKIMVLQDCRVSSLKLSFDSLLVLFEGETVTIPLPKNMAMADFRYNARCPIFVSSGDKFRISTAEAAREQVDFDSQNAMMAARFTHFYFHRSKAQQEIVECPSCPRCYACWVKAPRLC